MRKIFTKLGLEIARVLPAFLFFLFFFNLINMTLFFLYKHRGIPPYGFISIFVAAAIVAKALMVVDHFKIIDAFKNRPLVWNVLWKTFFYSVVTLLIRFIFRAFPFIYHQRSFNGGIHQFLEVVNLEVFLSLQLWYVMLFLIFVILKELITIIGAKRVCQIFLGIKGD